MITVVIYFILFVVLMSVVPEMSWRRTILFLIVLSAYARAWQAMEVAGWFAWPLSLL